MKARLRMFFFFFCVFASVVHADLENIEGDDVESHEYDQQPLFVSLGSYCAPASLARSCGHRKAAFPFDWNICLDGEKLIEILNDDFSDFLNDDYLVPFGNPTLLNTCYHLEFVHDGNWDGIDFAYYMQLLKSKYGRRIERFKNIKRHRGKVFFIRSAYIYSVEDRHRYYKIKENIEISDEYSLRLFNALKKYFPDLNFTLIIINNHEDQCVKEEKRINDSLLMVRAAPSYEMPVMQASYEQFFNELLLTDP